MAKIHLQTDADEVIWKRNLLISLGEDFVYDLVKQGKYKEAFGKLSQLALHYLLSKPVDKTHLAFVPFRDCPEYLIRNQYHQPIQKPFKDRINEAKEIYKEKRLNVVIVSENVESVIREYLRQHRKDFDRLGVDVVNIIANKDFNQGYTIITSKNKVEYLNLKIPYIGDKKEVKTYGGLENFVLVTESLYKKQRIIELSEENEIESLLECKI